LASTDTIYAARTPLFANIRRLEVSGDARSDGSHQRNWLTLFAFTGLLPLAYWRRGATDLGTEYEIVDDPDDFSATEHPGPEKLQYLIGAAVVEIALLIPLVQLLTA